MHESEHLFSLRTEHITSHTAPLTQAAEQKKRKDDDGDAM